MSGDGICWPIYGWLIYIFKWVIFQSCKLVELAENMGFCCRFSLSSNSVQQRRVFETNSQWRQRQSVGSVQKLGEGPNHWFPMVSSAVGNTSFWGMFEMPPASAKVSDGLLLGFSTFEQIMKDLKGIQFWDIPILCHSSTGTAGLRSAYPLLASQWRAGKGRTLTSQPCTPKKTDKCSPIRVAPTQWFALLVHGGQDTVTNPILELMMYGNHVPSPTNIEVSGKILWTQFRDYNKFGSFGFFPFQTLVIQENARPFLLTYHPLPETLGLWRCFDATTMSVQWFVRGPICVLPAICLGQ